jgi:hypothetical protein
LKLKVVNAIKMELEAGRDVQLFSKVITDVCLFLLPDKFTFWLVGLFDCDINYMKGSAVRARSEVSSCWSFMPTSMNNILARTYKGIFGPTSTCSVGSQFPIDLEPEEPLFVVCVSEKDKV